MKSFNTTLVFSIIFLGLIIMFTPIVDAAYENSLVGYWKMDGTWEDSTTNNNDGTAYGGSGYASGQYGQAGSFDGIDGYINVGDFDPTGSNGKYLSAFAYINLSSGSVNRNIFDKWDFGLAERSWQAFVDPDDNLTVILSPDGLGGSSYKLYTTTAVVADDSWHQVGFTWDDGALIVYVDGQEAEVVKTYDESFNSIFLPSTDVIIGANLCNEEFRYPFDGAIDDVALYDRVLNADEVGATYYLGTEGFQSGQSDITAGINTTFDLGYSDEEIDQLLSLYAQGKAGLDTEYVTINGITWKYLDTLPDEANHTLGESYIYEGQRYIYLGSGLAQVPELPSGATRMMVFLFGSLAVFFRRKIHKNI